MASQTISKILVLASFSFALAACSDNVTVPTNPNQPGDCSSTEVWDEIEETCVCAPGYLAENDECVASPDTSKECVLFVNADWSAEFGTISVYDVEKDEFLRLDGSTSNELTTVHQDSVVSYIQGELYVTERMPVDSVIKLDPSNQYAVDWQESLKSGTSSPNPGAPVRHGNFLYFPLYNEGKIVQANVNPIAAGGFLTGLSATLTPAEWDGSIVNIGAITVQNDTIFVLSEGLNDSWSCGSLEGGSPNRARIYALDPVTLEDKNVFAGDLNTRDLSFCNALGWTQLADGRTMIHAIGGYKAYGVEEDDGGIEIIDLSQPLNASVIPLREGDAASSDILAAYAFGEDIYIKIYTDGPNGSLFKADTTDDNAWTLATTPIFEGNFPDVARVGDSLFIAVSGENAHIARIHPTTGASAGDNLEADATLPTSQILPFSRANSCW